MCGRHLGLEITLELTLDLLVNHTWSSDFSAYLGLDYSAKKQKIMAQPHHEIGGKVVAQCSELWATIQ